MKMRSLILAVTAATLLAGPANSQEKANLPGKDKADESAKKVKDLQKERIATLKEVADQTFKLAQNSRIEFADALEARVSLLKAELEIAEKESDRIALYKKALETLKEYEAVAKSQFEAGRATQVNMLKIKARRLEIEILLEQATGKEAKAGK